MRRVAVLMLGMLMLIPAVSGASVPVLQPQRTIKAPQGSYLDESFAISDDSKVVAYVQVTEGGRSFLVFDGLGKRMELTKLTLDPVDLWFMPKSHDVVVVWQKGKFREAALIAPEGRVKARFKRVSDIIPSTRDGRGVIVTFLEEVYKSGTRYTVAVYDPASPKRPKVKKVISTNIKGRLTKPEEMEVGAFFDDYSKIYVKVIGKYDKKLDRKRPDVEGIYHVFTGKLDKRGIIARTAEWDQEVAYFRNHRLLRPVIKLVGVPTTSGVKGTFSLGLGMGAWKDIRPMGWNPGRFDFGSLSQARRPVGDLLYFTMAIDPQNPVTLRQKKSEKRYVHIFSVSVKDGSARDLGRMELEEGFIRWKTNGTLLATMTLHDTWRVGAFELHIYRIGR